MSTGYDSFCLGRETFSRPVCQPTMRRTSRGWRVRRWSAEQQERGLRASDVAGEVSVKRSGLPDTIPPSIAYAAVPVRVAVAVGTLRGAVGIRVRS